MTSLRYPVYTLPCISLGLRTLLLFSTTILQGDKKALLPSNTCWWGGLPSPCFDANGARAPKE